MSAEIQELLRFQFSRQRCAFHHFPTDELLPASVREIGLSMRDAILFQTPTNGRRCGVSDAPNARLHAARTSRSLHRHKRGIWPTSPAELLDALLQ
jgi:hypothetical protein